MYGIRLRELFTGGMTWRELGVYVRGLPPGSATRTAMRDGVLEPSPEAALLADVFDAVQWVRWQIAAHGVERDSKLPKPPKPYPRWWDPEHGRKKTSPQRVARIEAARRRAAERKRQIATGQIA